MSLRNEANKLFIINVPWELKVTGAADGQEVPWSRISI